MFMLEFIFSSFFKLTSNKIRQFHWLIVSWKETYFAETNCRKNNIKWQQQKNCQKFVIRISCKSNIKYTVLSSDKAPYVCECFWTHYIYWGICWLYVRLPVNILIDFHWSSRQPYIIEVFFLKVKICNITLFVHNKKHYCINFFKETHNSYFCVTFRF